MRERSIWRKDAARLGDLELGHQFFALGFRAQVHRGDEDRQANGWPKAACATDRDLGESFVWI